MAPSSGILKVTPPEGHCSCGNTGSKRGALLRLTASPYPPPSFASIFGLYIDQGFFFLSFSSSFKNVFELPKIDRILNLKKQTKPLKVT